MCSRLFSSGNKCFVIALDEPSKAEHVLGVFSVLLARNFSDFLNDESRCGSFGRAFGQFRKLVGENGEWEDRANYGLESIEKIVISMHVMK